MDKIKAVISSEEEENLGSSSLDLVNSLESIVNLKSLSREITFTKDVFVDAHLNSDNQGGILEIFGAVYNPNLSELDLCVFSCKLLGVDPEEYYDELIKISHSSDPILSMKEYISRTKAIKLQDELNRASTRIEKINEFLARSNRYIEI